MGRYHVTGFLAGFVIGVAFASCCPLLRGNPGTDPRITLHPRMVPLGEGRVHRAPEDTLSEDSP